jgi:hypothetical protein
MENSTYFRNNYLDGSYSFASIIRLTILSEWDFSVPIAFH